MLSLMRKHAGTWMIKIILGAIVIVFIFWGVGSYRSRQSGKVASVNGTIITLDAYRESYNNLIEQVRQSFGNNLNEELIRMLQLRKRALDQLVDKTLMLQAAEKLKLTISDAELAESIRNIRAFQTAGVFDSGRYLNILSRNRLTPEDFEVQQRETLIINKLQGLIIGSIKVSDLEAQQWYIWNNTETDIDYLVLEPQRYKDIKLTEEELRSYFDQHKDAYKTDPSIKVRYLYFNPEDYAARVKLTEDDIRDYYESNLDEFKTPETVEARHILIKVDQNADPEQVESARKKAEEIYKLAKQGQDFAELARKYSEGPTKTKGGYLGTFRREQMVKAFSDKAFSMSAGEISEPVRTPFGWHIIKVEKVNPAKTLTLEEAEADIRKKMTADRAKNIAYDDAEAVYDASFESQNLDRIAAERNLTIQTTGFFTQKKPPQNIKDSARFAAAAFELTVNEISPVQDFTDGYYLLEVVDKVQPQIPELKTVEDKVRNDLLKEKQDQKARDEANLVLKELKEGQSLAAVSQKFKIPVKQTGFFKRNSSIPEIGTESAIANIAFQLSDENRLPEEVLKGQKGYYVISFRKRREPSLEGFEKEKETIRNQLLQQKTIKTIDAWIARLRSESKISIEEGLLGT
jgi:peptidyl-prolyl cis-trans isomerase D